MSHTPGPSSSTASAQRVRVLFMALGAGATMVAATLTFLRLSGNVRIDLDAGMRPALGYGLSAVSLVLIAVAYGGLKSRVPSRVLGQSSDAYWAAPLVTSGALVFWALLEAASMAATVGFFLTGMTPPAAAILIALAVYWTSGPATFDRA